VNARSPVARISLGLVALTCTILLTLDLLGIAPSTTDQQLQERIQIAETLAQQITVSLSSGDRSAVRNALLFTVQRRDEVLSVGLRAPNGRLLIASAEHVQLWQPDDPTRATPTHASVPLFKDGEPLGRLEVRFESLAARGILEALWQRLIVRLTLLLGIAGFVAYLFYLRRTLRHLDPSAVVPARVQAALDVMVEGVLLLDDHERIVLANEAFARRTGREPASLLGVKASSLGWEEPRTRASARSFPWIRAIRDSEAPPDEPLAIKHKNTGEVHTFMAKGAPVLDGWGNAKGAIATFDDVTELERKTSALEEALVHLEKSQEEIRLQNEELEALARQDPLTGVSNRRHLIDTLEPLFVESRESGKQLCCMMVDIDHFKKVNDNHGHAMGDEVIQRVAEALTSVVRSSDFVCRYGGEEFLVVLPEAPIEPATAAAERLRAKIDSPGFARVPVTASFGVSSITDGAETFAALINQADEALYFSKENGRNRVTRWNELGTQGQG
jgi:diguanylate cyclase (GGDEF)-like protein/PAS domain S-box-containing protein